MNEMWLIWSLEHRAWWKPLTHGYTPARREAGRYSFQEAKEIVEGANAHVVRQVPQETMCPDWLDR